MTSLSHPAASASTPMDAARLDRARRAVAVVFVVNGLSLASWLSRLPEIRDRLGLTPGQVGLLLLCVSLGAIVALPLSSPVIHRLGPARTVLGGGLLATVALLALATGLGLSSVPVVAVALWLYGVAISGWDVAMNVEAADVELRLGRSIMPRFHAGFSIGTVAGALVGAACAKVGFDLSWQLGLTAAVVLVAVASSVRSFLPPYDHHDGQPSGSPWRAWREPRTVAIGLVVMAFALTEGIANDWIAMALRDGYGATVAVGSLAYAVFVSAMTLGRFVGGDVTDRIGRVTTLRILAVLVVAGVSLVVWSPAPWGAFVGAALWGLGACLGFPVGMTAAGEDPRHAAARLSVVSSIGYAAFLGGPPLVGAIADHVGVRDAIVISAGAALVAFVLASAVAPRTPTDG